MELRTVNGNLDMATSKKLKLYLVPVFVTLNEQISTFKKQIYVIRVQL